MHCTKTSLWKRRARRSSAVPPSSWEPFCRNSVFKDYLCWNSWYHSTRLRIVVPTVVVTVFVVFSWVAAAQKFDYFPVFSVSGIHFLRSPHGVTSHTGPTAHISLPRKWSLWSVPSCRSWNSGVSWFAAHLSDFLGSKPTAFSFVFCDFRCNWTRSFCLISAVA